jgi:hypothetical protein
MTGAWANGRTGLVVALQRRQSRQKVRTSNFKQKAAPPHALPAHKPSAQSFASVVSHTPTGHSMHGQQHGTTPPPHGTTPPQGTAPPPHDPHAKEHARPPASLAKSALGHHRDAYLLGPWSPSEAHCQEARDHLHNVAHDGAVNESHLTPLMYEAQLAICTEQKIGHAEVPVRAGHHMGDLNTTPSIPSSLDSTPSLSRASTGESVSPHGGSHPESHPQSHGGQQLPPGTHAPHGYPPRAASSTISGSSSPGSTLSPASSTSNTPVRGALPNRTTRTESTPGRLLFATASSRSPATGLHAHRAVATPRPTQHAHHPTQHHNTPKRRH